MEHDMAHLDASDDSSGMHTGLGLQAAVSDFSENFSRKFLGIPEFLGELPICGNLFARRRRTGSAA